MLKNLRSKRPVVCIGTVSVSIRYIFFFLKILDKRTDLFGRVSGCYFYFYFFWHRKWTLLWTTTITMKTMTSRVIFGRFGVFLWPPRVLQNFLTCNLQCRIYLQAFVVGRMYHSLFNVKTSVTSLIKPSKITALEVHYLENCRFSNLESYLTIVEHF